MSSGQTQAVAARFNFAGERHTIGSMQRAPRFTVPDGQTHSPATGPGTSGGLHCGGRGGLEIV
jgi:hypothetical protein